MKAVILAGGSGTRLWPVSRYGLPKQFIKLNGEKSLLGQTVERLASVVPLKDIFVITNEDYRFHVQADLKSVSPAIEGNIILEPVGRNTAPAIALVIKYCQEKLKCHKDEVIFICPSDHIIEPSIICGSSRSLRPKVRSELSKRPFATCMVIVLPP